MRLAETAPRPGDLRIRRANRGAVGYCLPPLPGLALRYSLNGRLLSELIVLPMEVEKDRNKSAANKH